MHRRRLNMSAALALAIERQVEDILTQAKTACALHRRAREGEDGEAFDEAPRPGVDFAAAPPVVEPARARSMDLWKRLRFAWAPRRFSS
jgi:hypothetical protein